MRTSASVSGGTVLLLGLICLLLPSRGLASSPAAMTPLPSIVLNSPPLPGDESIRARLKACLLMGDLSCVVDQYLLLENIGRVPGWLVAFQNAFAVASRKAGECEKVAKLIHEGLTRLGQRPEFLRFTIDGQAKVMGFDEVAQGVLIRTHQISTRGYHVAVWFEGRVIDAYTGPAGLPLREYMVRLNTSPGSKIVEEVVQTL